MCEHNWILIDERKTFVDWFSCEPYEARVKLFMCKNCDETKREVNKEDLELVSLERKAEAKLYKEYGKIK